MSLKSLPEPPRLNKPANFQSDLPPEVLTKWSETTVLSEHATDENVITIYDVIGEDYWTGEGVTEKRVAGALRNIGENPVTVRINSPGGDLFSGIAIYNLLRRHPAKVTVEIVSLAASAASIIAMAGDEIIMDLGSFVMIHNAWGLVVGNQHDMRDSADMFEQFDDAIVDIYQATSDLPREDIYKLMNLETFMSPETAISNGFAHKKAEFEKTDSDVENSAKLENAKAVRTVEAALAKSGMTRRDRTDILNKVSTLAPRDAGHGDQAAPRDAGRKGAQRDASAEIEQSLRGLLDQIKN